MRVWGVSVLVFVWGMCGAAPVIQDKGPLESGVSVTDSVFPGDYHMYTVTPEHTNFDLRVIATTTDDNINLLVKEDTPPTLDSEEYYASVRESNPWGVDVLHDSISTNTWYIAIRGANEPPMQNGNSDYTLTMTLEPHFEEFLTPTCPSYNATCGFVLKGDAIFGEDNVLRLTHSTNFTSGAAWWGERVPLVDGFEMGFTFILSDPSQECDPFCSGGDGFAFVIQNAPEGVDFLGRGDSGLGYEGVTHAVVVEFDTWYNEDMRDIRQGAAITYVDREEYVSYQDNHVAIMGNGVDPVLAHHDQQLRGTPSIPMMLTEPASEHTVRIKYFGSNFWIYMDDMRLPVLTANKELQTDVEVDAGGTAWIGFTASTGTEFQTHDITSWYFCHRVGCDV